MIVKGFLGLYIDSTSFDVGSSVLGVSSLRVKGMGVIGLRL